MMVIKKNSRLNGADILGTKLGDGILVRHRRRNDNVITGQPVDRSGDALLVGSLQRLHDTQHLGRVAAGGGWVRHGQANLLAGVDNKNGADGQGHALVVDVGGVLVVDHVVQVGNLALRVRDDGELEVGAADFVNVLDPPVVRVDFVGAL